MIAHDSSAKPVSSDQFIHCDTVCHIAEPGRWQWCSRNRCNCCGCKLEILPAEEVSDPDSESPTESGEGEIVHPVIG